MFLLRGRGKLQEEEAFFFIVTIDDISSWLDNLVASVGSGEMQCAMMVVLDFLIMVLLWIERGTLLRKRV